MNALFRIIVHSVALLVVALGRSADADEESSKPTHPIEGTWRWTFAMPDGTTTRPKLILAMRDGKLTGTSSFRPGSETSITNAVLNGDELRFQVIRQREGQDIVTTYMGQWRGQEIKGRIESNWAGEKQTFDWEAQRAKLGIEGTWQWTNYFGGFGGGGGGTNSAAGGGGGGRFGGRGGRGFVMRIDLEQNGEILTGSMPGFRDGRRTEIKKGTIKNGEFYFEIERTFGEDTFVTKYSGKQAGDMIKGTIASTTLDGEERKTDWVAKRVD